jgi:hypothetical protein
MNCRFCGQHVGSLVQHRYDQAISEHMRAMAMLPRRSLRGTAIAKERARKAALARWAKVKGRR